MKRRLQRTILAVGIIVCTASTAVADSFDAAVQQVEQAVRPQRSGEHLNLLFALRQLRVPSMRPLFYQLVQHPDWPVQVHAVLGLAELSDNGQVDPWLVRQMNPSGHEAVIANALDLDLLGPEAMRELLRHDELGPMPRLLLLAELVADDQATVPEHLEKLADHADMHISGLAAALLMQQGDASKFSAVRDRLSAASARERNTNLQWLFEAIRQYELTAALPWVREVLNNDDLEDPVQFAGVFALAALGDPHVMTYWTQCLGSQPRHAQLIRYALLLLVCAETVPTEAFDALPKDDPLLDRIAATGRAIQTGRNVTGELRALLDLDHRKSTELVMPYVEQLPDADAATVYAHLIDRLATDDAVSAERITVAVQAASKLVQFEPDMVLDRLVAAEDDSVHQQAILLGLMDAHLPAIGERASSIRRIGAGRADSLTLLLIAKNGPTLDREQLEQLGLIASGGGRVSEVLQTQAAWLYIQHTGATEKALSRLFPQR